jgi:hypothetical protein
MSRIPHFLDNRLTDDGLTRRPRFTLISVRGWVNPRTMVRLKGLDKLKNIQRPHRDSNPPLSACSLAPRPSTLESNEMAKQSMIFCRHKYTRNFIRPLPVMKESAYRSRIKPQASEWSVKEPNSNQIPLASSEFWQWCVFNTAATVMDTVHLLEF